jgi:hypothetical protein
MVLGDEVSSSNARRLTQKNKLKKAKKATNLKKTKEKAASKKTTKKEKRSSSTATKSKSENTQPSAQPRSEPCPGCAAGQWIDAAGSTSFPLVKGSVVNVTLPFSFPFQGLSQTDVGLSPLGFLTLSGYSGAVGYPGEVYPFLTNGPRIAVDWNNFYFSTFKRYLLTSTSLTYWPNGYLTVKFVAASDHVAFSWIDVYEDSIYCPNTFQIVLWSTGKIDFNYRVIHSGPSCFSKLQSLIGVTPGTSDGASENPGEVDFSAMYQLGPQRIANRSVYAVYQGNLSPVVPASERQELDNKTITFTPDGLLGWCVCVEPLND